MGAVPRCLMPDRSAARIRHESRCRQLARAGVPTPAVDAELLVGHVAGLTRSGVHVAGSRFLGQDELAKNTLPIGRELVAICIEVRPRNAERVREQPLRVDARRRHPGTVELLGPGNQEVADGHASRARR